MAYKSSPRPVFDGPTPIPCAAATRHIWGDVQAGQVDDWIDVSSGQIHQLVFGLPPGDGFRHSPSFRTVFGADEVLTVLMGTMVIANPETGEVHLVQTGESVFFQEDTWHHAFALGDQELRVLQYFAPPPSTASSGKYAATRPYVYDFKYERTELIGHWPADRAGAEARATIPVLREADRLWSLDRSDPRVLTGIVVSTDQLTAGSVRLNPGGRSAPLQHGGAAGLYALKGRVNILIDDPEAPPVWFVLHPQDGFYIPEGTKYRAFNMGDAPAEYLFGAVTARCQATTNYDRPGQAILSDTVALAHDLHGQAQRLGLPVTALGLGVAELVSPAGWAFSDHRIRWTGLDVAAQLSAVLPTTISADVRAAALREARMVIGGGLGSAPGPYFTALTRAIRAGLWDGVPNPMPITQAALGPDAGLIGATCATDRISEPADRP